MSNRILKFLKRQWLLVWIVAVSVLIAGSIIAYAEFPSALTTMKRVVASISDYGSKFSSNVLIENGDKTYVPSYKDELADAEKQTSTYDVVFDIWNYSAKNPLDWYKKSIKYNISFKFVDRKGDELKDADVGTRTVGIYKGTTLLMTLNSTTLSSEDAGLDAQTLLYSEGNSDYHEYTFKFKGTWNLETDEDICVQMIATPDKTYDAYNDISPLGAIIGLRKTNSGSASGWTAYLSEHPNSTGTEILDEFDGFNMIVTGSGKATITITWDTSKVDMNKYFRDSSKTVYAFDTTTSPNEVVYTGPDTENGGTTATLVINADSSSTAKDYRTRYNIQVYKNGTYEPTNWNFFAVKDVDSDAVYNAASVKVQITSTE